MPATKDGRCWSCVQRRRWYPADLEWVGGDTRHLLHEGQPLCALPRRGRSRDPEVVKEYERRYRAKRTPAYLAKRRRQTLAKYGLTPEDHAALVASQDGRCASCNDPLPDRAHTDHDHETGEVRGILCPPCNLMIGHAKNEPSRLVLAAAYLLRPESLKAKAVTLVRELANA